MDYEYLRDQLNERLVQTDKTRKEIDHIFGMAIEAEDYQTAACLMKLVDSISAAELQMVYTIQKINSHLIC